MPRPRTTQLLLLFAYFGWLALGRFLPGSPEAHGLVSLIGFGAMMAVIEAIDGGMTADGDWPWSRPEYERLLAMVDDPGGTPLSSRPDVLSSLPTNLQESLRAVAQRLGPEDELEWIAQPLPPREPGYYALFGLSWMLFSGFFLFQFGSSLRKLPLQSLLGVGVVFAPIFAVGLGIATSPLRGARRGRRTVYALTERHAIIVIAGKALSVEEFPLERVAEARIDDLAGDGSGDLVLEVADAEDPSRLREVRFRSIPRAAFALAMVKGFRAAMTA